MSTRLSTSCSEEKLRSVELPKRTVSYTPVPNDLIFDVLHEKLDEYGLRVKQSDLTMSPNGKRFIGLFDIESYDEELGYRIGFKNSYDGSMSFGLGIGSVVWLCSNGMVHGEVTNKRVHRGNADKDVEDIIKIGLDQYQKEHDQNIRIKEIIKEITCTQERVFKIMGELCYKGVFNGNELVRFKKELNESKLFMTLKEEPHVIYGWDVYNHITEVLKKSSYNSYFEKHKMAHDLLCKEFKI